MRLFALLGSILLFACSHDSTTQADPPSASPDSIDSPTPTESATTAAPGPEERALTETLASIEELTALLGTVKDAATAANARARVEVLCASIRTTQAQADSVAFLPKAKQDALQVKFESRLKGANAALVEQLRRTALQFPNLSSQLTAK